MKKTLSLSPDQTEITVVIELPLTINGPREIVTTTNVIDILKKDGYTVTEVLRPDTAFNRSETKRIGVWVLKVEPPQLVKKTTTKKREKDTD